VRTFAKQICKFPFPNTAITILYKSVFVLNYHNTTDFEVASIDLGQILKFAPACVELDSNMVYKWAGAL